MRKIIAAGCAVAAALAVSLPAVAGGPTRTFLPAPPILITGVCPFPVTLTFPVNQGYVLTFTDSAGNITREILSGHLTSTWTNDDTGASLTANLSGPGVFTFHPDGSVTLAFMGPQGGPSGNLLLLGAGRQVFNFAPDGSLVDHTQVGHFVNICATLGG